MLIDSAHSFWIRVTLVIGLAALGLYALVYWLTPGGLTGGSLVGLGYGLAGTALLIGAGLLSAHRHLPRWWYWLGPRKLWLRAHIWLGLLAGVLILCHSGFRWGGPLEVLLWIILLIVLGTGVLGLALQQVLPRMLTTRITAEAPYEQIPHLCDVLCQKADALIEKTRQDKLVDAALREGLVSFHESTIRPYLAHERRQRAEMDDRERASVLFGHVRKLPGAAAVESVLADLESYCDERRSYAEQERLHLLLHGWLLVHVPLSVSLLVLGLAHAIVSLWY